MNKVILSGNLCRDIELRRTNSGKEVVSNAVAVSRDYKDPDGNYSSDFINIVVWGSQANYLCQYATKGDRVELVGRWTNRSYEDAKGVRQTVNECVVESIKVFRKNQDTQEDTQEKSKSSWIDDYEITEDDLPF